MIPKRIAGGKLFGPPEGHEDICTSLAVCVVDGDVFESVWEPTPAELAVLNAGGHVVLSVKGFQPMVRLSVEPLQGEGE